MKPRLTCLLLLFSFTLPGLAQDVVLSDNFDDGVLASHWSFDSRPFETGTIDIGGGIIDGAMRLEVTALSDFWGGFALRTERTFAASAADPLSFQVTRVADEGVGITRSGVWIMNSDRSQYVFVSQNIGEGGWQYNRRIGEAGDNPTGAGANIDAFDALDEDFDAHDIRLVANGATVEIYLDDQLGAEVDFPLSDGIVFGFGVYARSVEDDAVASFDNIEIKSDLPSGLPCVTLEAPSTALFAGDDGSATVTAPRLFISENAATVTITSSDPEVATLEGANAVGELTVNFRAGGQSSVPLKILAGKGGTATFTLSVSDPLCAGGGLTVSVSSAFIRNPSFEQSEIAEWPGYGEIADWSGGSGVNNGEITPFGDNGIYPDGQIIAFSQGARELSQDISGLDPSKLYHVSFRYNARQCCGGTISLSVFFNDQQIGQTLENVQPVGNVEPYYTFNGVFQPATPSGSFIMTTAAEGDATLVFDAVSIVERSIDDLVLSNSSFEASGRAPDPGYLTAISGWDGVGTFGVNVGGSGPFANNGTSPDQDLVAFIQGEGSSLSQTLNSFLVGESYTLEYAVNAREGNVPSLKVALDGTALSEEVISPVGGTEAYLIKTVDFTATDVTHTITFEQTAVGDQSVLLDKIRLLGEASNVPCVPVTPEKFAAGVGQTGDAVTITMPEEALADGPVTVTVSNSNPSAFRLVGADANGSVQLEFTVDGDLTQSAAYEALAKGKSIFALTPSKVLCLEASSVAATALAGVVRNPGFESNYPETWPHYGPIDEWDGLGGNSGTNLADGPFHDNGIVPDGRQVGFGQGAIELSQEIGGLEVGASYLFQFYYNVRNCCGGTMGLAASFGDQELFNEALVEAVGPEVPYHFANIPFTPTTDAGTLRFTGTAEGDATYLIDGITIVKRAENEAVIINPSFEATSAATLPAPGYLGTVDAEEVFNIGGWEAAGNYGINSSGDGPFADNGVNPDQDDVVFLQGAGSSISQSIGGLTAGETYTLTYSYNARNGNTPSLQVDIGGNLAQQTFVSPVGGTQPYHDHSFSFQAADSTAVLSFTQTAEGDHTVLIDDVHLIPGGEAVPCVTVSPGLINVDEGTNGEITVRVPDGIFVDANEFTVILATDAPGVANASPSTLTFNAASARVQTAVVNTGTVGVATLAVTASDGVCLSRESVSVTVNAIVIPEGFVANGSFEADALPAAPGYGPVGEWIKEGPGNSGINDAAGPFHNNGLIPEGNQIALMQNTLSLTQTVRGLEAGAPHALEFHYNVREGFTLPDLTVTIDGAAVAELKAIEPVGADQPYHFLSVPFTPTESSVTLQFASFVEDGGDGTLLLDAVRIRPAEASEPPVPLDILVLGANDAPDAGADANVMAFLEAEFGAARYMNSEATDGSETADVIVMSSTFGSGSVRGKFHNSSVPIVNWEEAVMDSGDGEFGQSLVTMTKSTDTLQMALGDHPIAGALAGTTIDYVTGDAETLGSAELSAGTVAVGTGVGGAIDGLAMLFVTDAGGEVGAGSGVTDAVSPARRVALPMTDATFDSLTDAGKTLFTNSILWAAGREGPSDIDGLIGYWPEEYVSTPSDHQDLGTLPALTVDSNFTWSFWVNSEETDNNNVVFGNRFMPDGTDFAPREFIKFTPKVFEWHFNGGGENVGGEPTWLPIGVWSHNLVVKNGSTITYYRDGAEIATGEITGAPVNPQPLYLGGQPGADGNTTEGFAGTFKEVAIFDRALSVDDVADVYDRGLNDESLGSVPEDPEGKGAPVDVGFGANGAFGFTLPNGVTADIEYSTDLINWEVIATGVSGMVEDGDAGRSAAPAGYYRAQ